MTSSCLCGHSRSYHLEYVYCGYYWDNKVGPCRKKNCSCIQFYRGNTYRKDFEIDPSWQGNWKPEQIEALKKLKSERKPEIIIDKDFHEMFCQVLKEQTNRECDCMGTTSEVRKKE